jgi:hypothetical protein
VDESNQSYVRPGSCQKNSVRVLSRVKEIAEFDGRAHQNNATDVLISALKKWLLVQLYNTSTATGSSREWHFTSATAKSANLGQTYFWQQHHGLKKEPRE